MRKQGDRRRRLRHHQGVCPAYRFVIDRVGRIKGGDQLVRATVEHGPGHLIIGDRTHHPVDFRGAQLGGQCRSVRNRVERTPSQHRRALAHHQRVRPQGDREVVGVRGGEGRHQVVRPRVRNHPGRGCIREGTGQAVRFRCTQLHAAQGRRISHRRQVAPENHRIAPGDREGGRLVHIRVGLDRRGDRVGSRIGRRHAVGVDRAGIVCANVEIVEVVRRVRNRAVAHGNRRVGLGLTVVDEVRWRVQLDGGDHLQAQHLGRGRRGRSAGDGDPAGRLLGKNEVGVPLPGGVFGVVGQTDVLVAAVVHPAVAVGDKEVQGRLLDVVQPLGAGRAQGVGEVRQEATLEHLVGAEGEVVGQGQVEVERVGRGEVAAERRGARQPDHIVHRVHRGRVVRVEAEQLEVKVQPAAEVQRRCGQNARAVPGIHHPTARDPAHPAGTAQHRVGGHRHRSRAHQGAVDDQLAGVHSRRPGIGVAAT